MNTQKPNAQTRVVVAMSGGVDSSVAAALLVEQGYDVVGMMMRLWSEPGSGAGAPQNRCCTPDQMADARRVAAKLDIPFYVIDVKDFFRQRIVQFFIDEHAQGRTPNPCIECNRQVRFTYLRQRALTLDADFLATGHYAQVVRGPAGFELHAGVDSAKDQSYVLHMLNQEQLSQVMFPIGAYRKAEVRALAARFELPVAQKSESMDLCFLGDGDYRRFLAEHAPGIDRPGPVLTQTGERLGEHGGLTRFTIGQRKGLPVNVGSPLFVLRKDPTTNALIVGPRTALGRQQLTAHTVNWINGAPPPAPLLAGVKIRYKAHAMSARITPLPDGRALVEFDEPLAGITAGQAAVFFAGDRCLGGGIIADATPAGDHISLNMVTAV